MCVTCHNNKDETDVCGCHAEQISKDGLLSENQNELITKNENSEALERIANPGKIGDYQNQNIVGACSQMIVGSYENKTKILKLINGGSFGHIYLGECLSTNTHVAVKAEQQGTGAEKLLQEGNVYYKLQGGPGIPKVFWYGMHGSHYNFLVMELLGPSLANLFHLCEERFSLPTVAKLIIKMLNIIRYVHDQDLLHRDISPDNFVIKYQSHQEDLYLIDFGLAKKCNTAGKMVLPRKGRYGFQVSRGMVGTPRFASLGVHQGLEEGRRDDLESLAYMTIFLLKGSLPWQGSNSSSETLRFAEIAECKARLCPSDLCSSLPEEFTTFLSYIKAIKNPLDIPDYDGLIKLFETCAARNGIKLGNVVYDWENKVSLLA